MRLHRFFKQAAACLLFFCIIFFGFQSQSLAIEGPGGPGIVPGGGSAVSVPDDRAGGGTAGSTGNTGSSSGGSTASTSGSGAPDKTIGPGGSLNSNGTSSKPAVGPGGQLFGGGSLSLLSDSGNRQMLGMVLKAPDNTLVVIDGGWADDSGHLKDVILSHGGHVSGWFITHPHSDHVGALMEILNDPNSQVTIDNVYYNLTSQDWYDAHGAGRETFVKDFREALAKLPAEKLHGDITKGQEITLGGIRAVVMNNPYLLDATSINNSSVAYKFFLNGVSILVLGDLGPEGGDLLLADHPDGSLKSDIVQMSHHGQYGVGRNVYTAINAQIALWPCPLWLWNNDSGGGIGSGDWKTLETRQWMEELGVRANYCIKDGDQVIY